MRVVCNTMLVRGLVSPQPPAWLLLEAARQEMVDYKPAWMTEDEEDLLEPRNTWDAQVAGLI